MKKYKYSNELLDEIGKILGGVIKSLGVMKNAQNYKISSKLYCVFCGSLLTRRNWNANRNCAKAVWQCIKRAKHGKEECPHCKAIPEEILEDCFVQGYRILFNDNRKVYLKIQI